MGSLFKSKTPTATTSNSVTVPEWLDSRNQSLASRADSLSQRPYTPYAGQRVADTSADTNQAYALTRQNTGKYNDLLSSTAANAGTYAQRGLNGPTSQDIQSRMNPYLQNVLDVSKRKLTEDAGGRQEALKRQAGLAGAFGGSRFALKEQMQERDLMQELDDMQYKGLFDAFNQANTQFNTDTDVLGKSINAGLNTASQGQAYDQGDIRSLLGTGALQQEQQQNILDSEYDAWTTEQAYPYEQVNFLSNILNPQTDAYRSSTSTSTQTGGSGSTAGKVLGTAASIASLFSDERVKENIESVGQLDNGLTVYKYNYKGSPKTQIGIMAQEVEKSNPDAVSETKEGIKMVDYDKAAYATGGGVPTLNREQLAKVLKNYQMGQMNTPSAQISSGAAESNDFGDLGGLKDLFGSIGNGSMDIMDMFSSGSRSDIGLNLSGGFGPYRFADGGRITMNDPGFKDILSSISGGEDKMTPQQAAAFTAQLIKDNYGQVDLKTGKSSVAAPELDREALNKLIAELQGGKFADGGGLTPRAAAQRAAALKANDPNTRTPILSEEGDITELLSEPRVPVAGEVDNRTYTQGGQRSIVDGLRDMSIAVGDKIVEDPIGAAGMGLMLVPGVGPAARMAGTAGKAGMQALSKAIPNVGKAIASKPGLATSAAGATMAFGDDVMNAFKGDESASIRADIEAKKGITTPTTEDNLIAQSMGEAGNSDVGGMSMAPSTGGTATGISPSIGQGSADTEFLKQDLLKLLRSSEEDNTRRKAKGPTGKEINTPLLMAGIAMMTNKGDFFDQMGAGAQSYMGEFEKQENTRVDDLAAKSKVKRENLSDYLDILKMEGYLQQVAKQGNISPYQQAMLQIQMERLALARQKLEAAGNDPLTKAMLGGSDELSPEDQAMADFDAFSSQ